MTMISLFTLVALLTLMIRHSRGTSLDYANLKVARTTSERCAFYSRRLLKSAKLFGVGGLVLLICSGGLTAFLRFPDTFEPAARWAREQDWIGVVGFGDLPHLVFPVMVGMSLTALVAVLRPKAKVVTIGDIGAILPRNGREIGWGALISLNAGISEELCFRVAVPFSLTMVLGNALFAFVMSTVLFGLLHRYQGIIGIVFTTLIGGVLAIQYLATGNLLLVMVMHAGFNLMAMVVRPAMILLFAWVRDRLRQNKVVIEGGPRI